MNSYVPKPTVKIHEIDYPKSNQFVAKKAFLKKKATVTF